MVELLSRLTSYDYPHYLPLVIRKQCTRYGRVLLLCVPWLAYHDDRTLWCTERASPRIQGVRYHDRRVHTLRNGPVRHTERWTVLHTLMCRIVDDTMQGSKRARLLLWSAVCQARSRDVWMGDGPVRGLMATYPCQFYWLYENRWEWEKIQTHEVSHGDATTQFWWDRKSI